MPPYLLGPQSLASTPGSLAAYVPQPRLLVTVNHYQIAQIEITQWIMLALERATYPFSWHVAGASSPANALTVKGRAGERGVPVMQIANCKLQIANCELAKAEVYDCPEPRTLNPEP